ncbi:putative neutral alkaline non-lysosomal ceramidase [Rosellinia necatrix]|uniref:Putative neutral alkaline non-lysosomal ceramidase n=1 Tax=Rosellinia necatrix TaxID=77044 RepID=A0A1W2TWN9_ROSNE|nr:putative neutral alkaline non-lysosomal ceramidase [Rosellinia necatrix]
MASLSPVSKPFVGQCDNCHGAKFDDAKSGGHQAKLATGRIGLHFTLDRANKSVFDYGWTLDDSLPLLPRLSATAEAGCEFCQFLINVLRSQDVTCLFKDVLEDTEPSNEMPFRLFCSYTWGSTDFVLVDKHGHGGGSSGLRSFQLRAIFYNAKSKINASHDGYGSYCVINCLAELPPDELEEESSTWLGLKTAPVPLSVTNRELLSSIRTTLHNCFSQTDRHKICGKPRDSFFLPTRLIEIGHDTQVLRLVHSSDIKNECSPNTSLPQYTALSYCWGEMQGASYKLTSQTEATMMVGLKLCALPQVLQDAIVITKALSLSYIWIDALCILQDSTSDWENESSQMGDIYGSAYVTVCSLTPSCQYSFLKPERPKTTVSFQSSINPDMTGSYTLSYLDADMDNAGREPYMRGFPKSRWFSRGWTYQELRFSKRLLLLSPSYSAFLCAGLFSVFGGPEIDAPMIPLHNLDHLTKDARRIYDIWLEFGQRYSGRILTYPQDALPAISGAAKLFAEKLSDDYLAGIWRSDLRGLMWCYPSIPEAPSRNLNQVLAHLGRSAEGYVAPSWSWIGQRYISFYFRPPVMPRTILLQCKIEISTLINGQNIFGRVKGGRLIVTGPTYDLGPCITISIRLGSQWRGVPLTVEDGGDIFLSLDWKVVLDSLTEQQITLQANLKLILIGTYEIVDKGNVTTITAGLITHKVDDTENFYRVGRFDLSSPNGGIHKLFAKAKTETITII